MAEIIKINEKNLKKAIEKAAEIVKNCGTIVYPTDTLYGLGVNALEKKSVEKVFEIKGRNYGKPISIAVSSLTEAKKYAEFSSLAVKIGKKFLPGPLTLILPSKENLPKHLNPDENVRIRIPDNKIALEIIKKSRVPLTATSANLSGGKDPDTAKEAVKQIGDKVDLVLDAGKCKYRKGSTIVKIVDGKIEIIRKGVIRKEDLLKAL
jgi:L-threonylcarbamoyladenylate synthase